MDDIADELTNIINVLHRCMRKKSRREKFPLALF